MAEEEVRTVDPGIDADLVKSLRELADFSNSPICSKAADRILELRASVIASGQAMSRQEERIGQLLTTFEWITETITHVTGGK